MKDELEAKSQLQHTHCHQIGHLVRKCEKLYPKFCQQCWRKVGQDPTKNEKVNPTKIIQEIEHDEMQLKMDPLKCLGKKWITFLHN